MNWKESIRRTKRRMMLLKLQQGLEPHKAERLKELINKALKK